MIKKTPTIAYLFGSLNRGGTESLMLDVFRNLSNNRLNAIGVYRKTGVLEPDYMHSGVKMHFLPTNQNIIQYLLRLRRLLVNNKVNIVHAQQPLDALYAYIACLGTGIKILLTLHGFDFVQTKQSSIILKFILHKTDKNLFVSDYQRKYYIEKYHLKIKNQKLVYNGISFEKLNIELMPQNSLREELKISSNQLLLGTIGNFNEVRDQMTLCRFALELKKSGVDFHLIFVGKRVMSCLERYDNCVDFCQLNGLTENVSFLGIRNDVPEILKQLDAFVYATEHDTFGIAVVEAMATGIPVFVNDWDVMSEITATGSYATLYKTRSEKDLVREFMLFLQHNESYTQKALDASNYVRNKFNIDRHIEELKKVYFT